MIKSKLPVIEQEIKDGQIISKESDIEIYIDTSLYAETRWEQNFPKQAEKEGLFEYVERIHKIYGEAEMSAIKVPVAISMIKAIYCFIETTVTWDDFQKMFAFNDKDYFEKLVKEIIYIFNLVLGGSAEKNLKSIVK